MNIPDALIDIEYPIFKTKLPINSTLKIDSTKDTALYTYYNLDPLWLKDVNINRVLILEPSMFEKHPSSEKCIDFMLNLGKANIPNLQVFVGEFCELQKLYGTSFKYKEHPLNNHFIGTASERDFISSNIQGNFSSFFGYWKKLQKEVF